MKENRFVIMRNRLKSREMVIQEEKEREKTLETMYEVDLLIDSSSIIMRKKCVPENFSNRVYGNTQRLTGSIHRLINNR